MTDDLCPTGNPYQKSFLNLLDKDMFIKRFCQDLPVILGQSMTRDEQAVYENEFHRNGLLQIIKEWDRGAKTKGK